LGSREKNGVMGGGIRKGDENFLKTKNVKDYDVGGSVLKERALHFSRKRSGRGNNQKLDGRETH